MFIAERAEVEGTVLSRAVRPHAGGRGAIGATSTNLDCDAVQLVQLACARPEGCNSPAPFRDLWTYRSLAEAVARRTGQTISTSEVGRILRFEDLRPHRVRQWLKSEDPAFLSKAEAVCQLYLHPPKDAIVVCFDEKPLQVLARKHATRVDPRDASVRFEYEYVRHGTQALLAAFDVRTGRVLGRVVPHRSADALVRFMVSARPSPSGSDGALMRQRPGDERRAT